MNQEAHDLITAFVELTEMDPEAEIVGSDLWTTINQAHLWLEDNGKPQTTYGQLMPRQRQEIIGDDYGAALQG